MMRINNDDASHNVYIKRMQGNAAPEYKDIRKIKWKKQPNRYAHL
jgi:hypothetical protein